MFICHFCSQPSAPTERPEKVVLRTRRTKYENKEIVSHGWEIVQEVIAHRPCATEHFALTSFQKAV